MRGTLVFDGKCGFCTRSAGWLRRLDRGRRVLLLPSQGHGVLSSTGLTADEAAESVWWLGSSPGSSPGSGRRARGAEAVNLALSAALGTRLPLALYRVTRPLQERAYAWVVANRYRLPGVTPHCERHPQDCAP